MLLDDENRIKWDKLEELVSIASNAGAALASDDFTALKRAQDQSDLIKRFSKNSADKYGISRTGTLATPSGARASQGGSDDASSDVSFDMIVLVMDYLLSEPGSFLLAPLIADIAGGCRLSSFSTFFPHISPSRFSHIYSFYPIVPLYPSSLSLTHSSFTHSLTHFLCSFLP